MCLEYYSTVSIICVTTLSGKVIILIEKIKHLWTVGQERVGRTESSIDIYAQACVIES